MDCYKEYGIYGIVNKINGKTYIGKTETNFGDRWDCHRASLRGGYGINNYLQNAWNKYGEENFEFVEIQVCDDTYTSDEINELEKEYILKYKSNGMSYNIGDGGDGGRGLGGHLSDEAKAAIGEKNREHMLGRKASESTKKKMSESQRLRYSKMSDDDWKKFREDISEYASGYKWSDESKKKFSEIQSVHPNGAKYDQDTVREIRRLYDNGIMGITEISNELNIPRPTVYGIATRKRWKNI